MAFSLPRLNAHALTLWLSFIWCAGCAPTVPLRQTALASPPTSPPRIALLGPVSAEGEPTQNAGSPQGAEILLAAHQQKSPALTTLNELIEIAVTHHPEVRAAHARVESARGRMVQAGLYPNPALGPNLADLGDRKNQVGASGARILQTIVTGGKLQIAKEAAARGVEAADWAAITKWHDTVLRVRLAYYELLTALREHETMADIVRISDEAHKTAKAFEKAGAGNRPDVLRAKVELEQNTLKQEVVSRRVEAGWQNLHSALGRPGPVLDRVTLDPKTLETPSPGYEWASMLTCLHDASSVLQEARALIAQQQKLVAKARADVTPDITVQVDPFYLSNLREVRTHLIVTAPFPLFDRNQGNIRSALADLSQAIADEQSLELQLTERLTLAYQRYQAARQQAAAYHDRIVPDARESLTLVQAGYKAQDRKYDYTAVLQAQQVLFQTKLAETQALGELWRAAAEIAALLQQDHVLPACGVKR